MLRKILLACGVLSSVVYVGADLLAAARYPEYHNFFSQATSELTAVGAPTKRAVEPLQILYNVLIIAFGLGVLTSASRGGPARGVGGCWPRSAWSVWRGYRLPRCGCVGPAVSPRMRRTSSSPQ